MHHHAVAAAGASALLVLAGVAFPAPALAQADAAGNYPVCSSRVQDACQNPDEGGAPGRSRASDYAGSPPAYVAASTGNWSPRQTVRRKKVRQTRSN